MKAPDVSVIIPCFNTKACVATAIDSALHQEQYEVEVIVVDDGSTDGTSLEVQNRYGNDPRVKLIRLAENVGPSKARNAGLDAASGEWIGLLDSDDWWLPNRLSHLLQYAETCDFIADNIMGFDATAQVQTGAIYLDRKSGPLSFGDFVRPRREGEHDLGYLQPLIRRTFLEQNNIRYNNSIRAGEDLLLNLQMLLSGARAHYVQEPLYVYALPVGPLSKAASPHSRSSADTTALLNALRQLRSDMKDRMSSADLEALDFRIDDFEQMAPIGAFHRAKAKRNIGEMLRLIATSSAVRNRIAKRLLGSEN